MRIAGEQVFKAMSLLLGEQICTCMQGPPDRIRGIPQRNRGGKFLRRSALEAGEHVHRNDFNPVPPVWGALLQPSREGLFRAALGPAQQARRAGHGSGRDH